MSPHLVGKNQEQYVFRTCTLTPNGIMQNMESGDSVMVQGKMYDFKEIERRVSMA